MVTDDDTTFAWLRAWRAGDRAAGQALIRAHQPRLARYLYAKLGPEAGKEIVQETFLALCEHLDRFRGEGSFDAFLFGVARRKVLEHIRRRATRGARQTGLAHDPSDGGPSSEDRLAAKFASNVIVQALRGLSFDDQVLLELHDHAGWTRQQLAELFDVPPGTVASRLHRARERLHKAAEELQATPSQLASTRTSLASYWAAVHARWDAAFSP